MKQFDVVLANPPYSMKKWNRELFASDPYGRNLLGVPPQGRADYAFLQHIIASMNPKTGRCAILFPHGVLFRDEERTMRRRLVESDVIECVIGLGANLFYNSPMEACIVVGRMSKPVERRRKVLFINALKEVSRENAQSFLNDEHIRKILASYRNFKESNGFASIASVDEILASDGNLSLSLHVQNETDTKEMPLVNITHEWDTSSEVREESINSFLLTMKKARIDD